MRIIEHRNKQQTAFVQSARVAHLATVDADGQPLVIPVCFVFDGRFIFSSIDEKPKRIAAHKLKRLQNIRANPQVSLVIDRYDENWSCLAYVLITGRAKILLSGAKHRRAATRLKRKYPQYRNMTLEQRPMISIVVSAWKSWGCFSRKGEPSSSPRRSTRQLDT
jgi:PPOX class probable F420-dependent enzyme